MWPSLAAHGGPELSKAGGNLTSKCFPKCQPWARETETEAFDIPHSTGAMAGRMMTERDLKGDGPG